MIHKEVRMEPSIGVCKAVSKALAMGGAAAVRRVRYGQYTLESATRRGTLYTVSQGAGGRLRCICAAGLAGRPCWHAAAVFIAKVEAKGARVTGPAGAVRPALANAVAFPARPAG
jgi:hypothetical protein